MQNLFFSFQSFDEEILKKMISLNLPAETMAELLQAKLKSQGMPENDLRKTRSLFQNFLLGSKFAQEKSHYLSHPIRVAACLADFIGSEPPYETISLALGHNLKEKMGDSYSDLGSDFISKQNRQNIEALTIDRSMEKDPVYLNFFYDELFKNPFLGILKAFDKLDNLCAWVLFDFERYHAEIILNFVVPRLIILKPELADYIRDMTNYVEMPETKAKFRELQKRPQFQESVKTFQGAK